MDQKNIFTKEFYEHYAKICLEYTYDKKYSSMIKAECPDWQCPDLDIGVEVTQGISKSKGHSRAVMASYFGKGYPDKYIPQEIYEPHTFNYTFDSSFDSFVDISGKQVSKAYLSKTIKLNSHYNIFNSNQLFIYAFKSLSKNDLFKCFQVDLSKFRLNFDLCYINCIDQMYVCDFVKGVIVDTVQFDLPELIWIKMQAIKHSSYPEDKKKAKE